MVELRGMTWNHTRGVAPLLAASAAFGRDNDDVSIHWDARSLQEFEETSVPDLAARYDLLMIDHPFAGLAAASGALVPLDEVLSPTVIEDQAAHSVGPSHRSYQWADHQWALATDAAAQVAPYRPDLLDALGEAVPRSWDEVLELAGRPERPVALPLNPTHLFCAFLALCANLTDRSAGGAADPGEPDSPGFEGPGFDGPGFNREVAVEALDHLYRLAKLAHPLSLGADPIGLLDTMAGGDEIAYSPLCFGYSNYARSGYASQRVWFADIPSWTSRPVGAVLGGVGMAISRRCASVDTAAAFLAFVHGAESQRELYFSSGGQPGHRAAWTDSAVNDSTGGFFRDTLTTLDLAMLRPRTAEYPRYQREAGQVLHDLFRKETASSRIVAELDTTWSAVALGGR